MSICLSASPHKERFCKLKPAHINNKERSLPVPQKKAERNKISKAINPLSGTHHVTTFLSPWLSTAIQSAVILLHNAQGGNLYAKSHLSRQTSQEHENQNHIPSRNEMLCSSLHPSAHPTSNKTKKKMWQPVCVQTPKPTRKTENPHPKSWLYADSPFANARARAASRRFHYRVKTWL